MKFTPCSSPVSYVTLAILLAVSIAATGQTTQVLYSFTGGSDGDNPQGPLVSDSAGNLYGVAVSGGAGFGVVFELSPPVNGQGSWTETVLHSFSQKDAITVNPGLVMDGNGNLYGTTFNLDCCGVAFRLKRPAKPGAAWDYSVIHRFGSVLSRSGSIPNGSLVFDAQGNLYGTTLSGGDIACVCGTVFELSPPVPPEKFWTERVIYGFKLLPDGNYPYAGVIFDSRGNLYGVTTQGGSGQCNDGEGDVLGCGIVFELSPSNGKWTETILFNFKEYQEDQSPNYGITLGPDGAIYGTGAYNVFRVAPQWHAGKPWAIQVLHEFTGGADGTAPNGLLIFDTAGNLIGTTQSEGVGSHGTAFKLSPPARKGGQWNDTTLADFGTEGYDSNQPIGGLVFGPNGGLYGTTNDHSGSTHGSVFAIVP